MCNISLVSSHRLIFTSPFVLSPIPPTWRVLSSDCVSAPRLIFLSRSYLYSAPCLPARRVCPQSRTVRLYDFPESVLSVLEQRKSSQPPSLPSPVSARLLLLTGRRRPSCEGKSATLPSHSPAPPASPLLLLTGAEEREEALCV